MPAPGGCRQKTWSPDNAFFLIWGIAEPPMIDPLAPEFRRQVRELFAVRSWTRFTRSPYGRWLARLNSRLSRSIGRD